MTTPFRIPTKRETVLRAYLDPIVERFERQEFIDNDPISIPYGFDESSDREVIGLFAALLAWGRRDVMLRKLEELCDRMRYRPFAFIRDFSPVVDGRRFEGFVHRTFNGSDASWLCLALQHVIRTHGSLDHLCSTFIDAESPHAGPALQGLSDALYSSVPGMPTRMRKHLPRPSSGSACKRLNLYFRWMVRKGPVDFGIWKSIRSNQLLVPLDVHSGRQARNMGMLKRTTNDWKATLELSASCRRLDAEDPSRYDFAFFGAGEAGEMLSFPRPSQS